MTDSQRAEIYAYDFDQGRGAIGDRRVLFRMDPAEGKPDGLLVDPEGYVLSVLFDGSAILRLDPRGDRAGCIALPVPRPTSCALSPTGGIGST